MTRTLRSRLAYEPRELKFGTSGRRGEIKDLTQLEVYINVTAELEFLLDRAKAFKKARGKRGKKPLDHYMFALALAVRSLLSGRSELKRAFCSSLSEL